MPVGTAVQHTIALSEWGKEAIPLGAQQISYVMRSFGMVVALRSVIFVGPQLEPVRGR